MHKLIIAICMAIASHFSLAGGHQEKPDGGSISMPSKVPAGPVNRDTTNVYLGKCEKF